LALIALFFVLPASAAADEEVCSERFPEVEWRTYDVAGPTTLATAGMNDATSERFAADVGRLSTLIQTEIGALDGSAVCLATPEQAPAFSDLVAAGQRLHVAVFGEDRIVALYAVETRMIDDALAYALPHVALWNLADELGLEGGYPEPLGSTIAHWYVARDTGRLDQYRSELVVTLFLDDPNPEDRTLADAVPWVGDRREDPYLFDPQFIGSQMGVFVDFAVAEEGVSILRVTDQETWAGLENRWRISIRDEFPRGNFGVWWGVGIFVFFILLAIAIALDRRRRKRKAAQRRPTPPADEELFESRA
jgi:hypothetical protein